MDTNRERTDRFDTAGSPEAEDTATSDGDPAVVAEVERMAAGRRIEKLGPGHYLVVDEDPSGAESRATGLSAD